MAIKVRNKIFLSWDDISEAVDLLCNKIKTDLPEIDSVHGLARGGLIPAAMVSHNLGLPYLPYILPNTLVIDDICDSGETLKDGPGVYTGVLYYKPHTSCFIPSIYSHLHKGDEWIIFPWENPDSETIQDYKIKP